MNGALQESRYVMHRGALMGPYTIDQLTGMRNKGVLDQFSRVSLDRALWENLDQHLAELAAAQAAPLPVVPPSFDGFASSGPYIDPAQLGYGEPLAHKSFPVIALLLLHYLTLGIFSFFWITGLHGKLPREKSDDPSGFKAVALCFIPFLQIYWLYFVYARLTHRVNSLSRQHRLPPLIAEPLSYVMATLWTIPILMAMAGTAILIIVFFSPTSKGELYLMFFQLPSILTVVNYLLVAPIYYGMVQASMNRISIVALRHALDHGA